MADKKAKEIEDKKTDKKAGRANPKQSIKAWMPYLPFASWIIGAVVITCLLFVFYNPSPTISAAYFVIIVVGFYILWRNRKTTRKKVEE